MRIALDVRYRTRSGASRYIHGFLAALREQSTEYDFVILRFAAQGALEEGFAEAILCPDWSAAGQIVWDQLLLPRILKRRRIDLYHSLKMLGPYTAPCPQVKVLHSITLPYRGEFPTSRSRALYWNVLGKPLYRSSTRLIAVSEFVRGFGTDVLGIPEERMVVIHNGIAPEFLRAPGEPASRTTHGIAAPFLLSVGNVFPVKNHMTAVKAFHKVAQRYPDYRLVIAGGTEHPYAQDVKRMVHRLGLATRVDFLGYVDGEGLIGLYRRATALLVPSLTEGFGLSVLEAMACGLPVIGSGRGGIPEVGRGAVYIIDDPCDAEAWAAAIVRLLDDPQLQARMREASIRRAASFSWAKTVAQTLALYDEVLAARAVGDVTRDPCRAHR